MSAPAIHIATRDPDAIPREGENLRRARTVFASGQRLGGAVLHAATLNRSAATVIHKLNIDIRRGA